MVTLIWSLLVSLVAYKAVLVVQFFKICDNRFAELKGEKLIQHTDALTKFLSNEQNLPRNLFECEFEDQIFQTEPETLPEMLARSNKSDEMGLPLSCADAIPVSFQFN